MIRSNPWLAYDAAEDLRELGRLDESEKLYEAALSMKSDMVSGWRGLALIARKRGDSAAAAENFLKARALEPSNPWLACDAAEDLRELGRLGESEKLYEAALSMKSDMVSGWRGRGLLARRQGRFDAAIEFFRRAAALAPAEVSIQRELILALRDLGRADEAEREAEGLLGRFPEAPQAIVAYAEAKRRRLNRDELVALYEKAVAAAPEDAWLRMGLAEEFFRADRFDDAEHWFERTLEQSPDHVGALVGKARLARRRGDRGAARQVLERAVAAPGATAWTRAELAQEMADAAEFETAETYLHELIQQAPAEEAYYVQLGQIRRLRGDSAGARAAFAEAVALNPGSTNALIQTAISDFNLGRAAMAIDALKPLAEKEQPSAQVLETLATFAERSDDVETGVALRRRALELEPARVWAHLELARGLAKLGRDHELADVLSACEARFGATIELTAFRARLLRDRADIAGALAAFAAASAAHPERFDLWADRIFCMIKCGQFVEAEVGLAKPPPCSGRENAQVALLRGQLAMAQWDADRAFSCFTDGLQINSSDSWLQELAARAALLRADTEASVEYIRNSAQTSASHRSHHGGACRPMQSIVGQLADEYRMDSKALTRLQECVAVGSLDGLADLVREFPDYTPGGIAYLTALRRCGAAPALDETSANPERPIPRFVTQFWDSDLPDDVQRLCDEWSRQEGFGYERFSAAEALHFIGETGAASVALAFRRAREPTSQADLFRLYVLYLRGGFYIDADDRLIGPLDGLDRGGKDLIVCLEDWGTAGNNFIAAAPGHPVIERALNAAIATLNSSDNEMIWLATGPGLLTRCLAGYIAEDAKRLSRVQIFDVHELPRAVGAHCATSHKYSRRHWVSAAFRSRDNSMAAIPPGYL